MLAVRPRGKDAPVDTIVVRPAQPGDVPGLTDLYNHYVRHTAITFDVEPYAVDRRRAWFEQFGPTGRYRLLVADEGGHVLGYAATLSYRPKQAYETSVETTVYVAPDATGRGIGTRLYTALFAVLAGEDVHRALAGITLPNERSIALHARFGFERVGVFHEQGRKFGRYWDVAWYEKAL